MDKLEWNSSLSVGDAQTDNRNFSKSPCIYDLMIQALPLITSGR